VVDDVTLVIKEIGAASFYSGQSVTDAIRVATRKPRSPHVVILQDEIDDNKLAALYRGCDILVLPYRGEAFGLPLAEALACGKPVITTELGPAREFCPPEASYFIPARVVKFSNPQDLCGPLTGANTVFEPDADELTGIMRSVLERPEEIASQGLRAADKVRAALSWARITRMYIQRIHHLLAL
jgi:glycosyltransferase involved in cell wall biosynthesis